MNTNKTIHLIANIILATLPLILIGFGFPLFFSNQMARTILTVGVTMTVYGLLPKESGAIYDFKWVALFLYSVSLVSSLF